MNQFRFDKKGIETLQQELGLTWSTLHAKDHGLYRAEREWNLNLTRVIDALRIWCKDHGIANYATGYTQIELCITFGVRADAMLFKLRWHDACTA